MDRTLLRNFAAWAKKELLAAAKEQGYRDGDAPVTAWFLELIALRFVTVNGYLPSGRRDLSAESAAELYNLLPRFLRKDAAPSYPYDNTENIIKAFTHELPSSLFDVKENGSVEVLGWLYQYFNSDTKDETFALLKQNVKISKDRVPSATQLFTPRWIVRYLVENSLGRWWWEHGGDTALLSRWDYYVREEGEKISIKKEISPEEIRFIDPCMGSGNILIYAFDLLMDIYLRLGYAPSEAVRNILEKNLFGLDIDDTAARLTAFVLLMKGRESDPSILETPPRLSVFTVSESNDISRDFSACGKGFTEAERSSAEKELNALLDAFADAKEYGSLLSVPKCDISMLRRFLSGYDGSEDLFRILDIAEVLSSAYHVVVTNPPYMGINGMDAKLAAFVKRHYPDSKTDLFSVFIERCSEFTADDGYFALITQPSLLFLSSFEKLRKKLLTDHTLMNLLHLGRGIFGVDFGSAAFVLRKGCREHIGSYFRLHERNFQYLDPDDIGKLYLCALRDPDFRFDFRGYDTKTGVSLVSSRLDSAKRIRFEKNQRDFLKLPGIPFGYWVSDALLRAFERGTPLGVLADSKQGLATTDNNKYLRFWYEVDRNDIRLGCGSKEEAAATGGKWFPYNKGGEFRKWYGNDDYIVNYENDGEAIKSDVLRKYPYLKTPDFVVKNTDYYFRPCFSWSLISSGIASFRYKPQGSLFDVAGMSCFAKDHFWYLLGLCNSVVAAKILEIIAPTINYQCGDIAAIPVIMDDSAEIEAETLVKENIAIAKEDWDAFEISFDFQKHPLAKGDQLRKAYAQWEKECAARFSRLKENEERLNCIFLRIYGLENEVSPIVAEKHIALRKADLSRDIRSLIAYGVGCLFGRYPLKDGGAREHLLIPITEKPFFEDDIVTLFCGWLKEVYGEESFSDNLLFIAEALGNKGRTAEETLRRYFISDFMKDHMKTYRKRPIYWLFESGKQKSFQALVYMHRWDVSAYDRILRDYILPMEKMYEKALFGEDSREKTEKHRAELCSFAEKLSALAASPRNIDLDDGVKINYQKAQTDENGNFYPVLKKI